MVSHGSAGLSSLQPLLGSPVLPAHLLRWRRARPGSPAAVWDAGLVAVEIGGWWGGDTEPTVIL